jgi:hypothetical protein
MAGFVLGPVGLRRVERDVLDVVAVSRNEPAEALGPQRGHDSGGTSAIQTRTLTSAASVKRSRKEALNAVCSTRRIARPASVAMDAGGVASISRVGRGQSSPCLQS